MQDRSAALTARSIAQQAHGAVAAIAEVIGHGAVGGSAVVGQYGHAVVAGVATATAAMKANGSS